MSILVIPGHADGEPHPSGRLASALFNIAISGGADPARIRRGRSYAADGAVQRLEVSPGHLVAEVQGSQANPYRVTVSVPTIDRPDLTGRDGLGRQLTRLMPESFELRAGCTCADWDAPCKHAIAAMVEFADALTHRPELLVELRCTTVHVGPAEVGARAKAGGRHLHLAAVNPDRTRSRPAQSPNPWQRPEWQAFLGEPPPPDPEVPDERAAVGRAVIGGLDLGEWLRSAIDQLTLDP